MSVIYKDQYFTLKDLLEYVGTLESKNFSNVTLANLWTYFGTNLGTISNLTLLEDVFNKYIIPTYIENSCFKITYRYYYVGMQDLAVSDILAYDELKLFMLRIKAFSNNIQALVDRYDKYITLISQTSTGASKTTKAVLKNNDTPQIYGSGDAENDGYVNNVQINTGSETNTESIPNQLEYLKYIEDVKYEIAKIFRNQVLID